ncbi:CCAAT/enhancer-binding protein zeta-like [Montipora capricornis]|uniref:CCAAT/enhancer-binding protein zeta-like n=1 Tax=Montipora capricornis TaxID=246305 RepID=UPI0035F1E878
MADRQAENVKRKRKGIPRVINDISLEDVLALGGDEKDFEMVKDIDVSGDLVTGEGDSEKIETNEIMSYIKELGLDKVAFEETGVKENAGENDGSSPLSDDKEVTKNNQVGKETKGKREKKPKSKDVTNTASHRTQEKKHSLQGRKRGAPHKLLITPGGLWYDLIAEENTTNSSLDQEEIVQLHNEAANLLQNEVGIYDEMKAKDKSSDSQWLRSVVHSGTLKDKVAALTVQVQESTVHRLKTLDILIGMAKKKGRRESIMAVDMLKELWMTSLLPANRKLRTFSQHPLMTLSEVIHNGGGWDERDRRLILWHFEELLKQRYKEFIGVVENLLHDTLIHIRSKILGTIFDLLSEKPEQEQVLLSLLVNKIGDPEKKVASKAVDLLRRLVIKHPNMKLVITKEMEKLLYRPNVAMKAQYYAICFLNQLILGKRDQDLATRLISIYFSFFRAFLKKGDMEAKLLSALLTGVNRAFPYAKEDDEQYNEQINTLFRTVHIGFFSTSVQALMLLFQVMESRQSVSDRFYQALYAKLLDPTLKASSKQALFLNVLYKSLKADPSLHRVKAFVKRVLQICSFQQPAFTCGVLFLISELTKLKPGIRSLIEQPEDDDDEEHFVDAPSDEDNYSDKNNNATSDHKQQGNHTDTTEIAQKEHKLNQTGPNRLYKPQQRNPLYSGAENSCSWELNRLCRHYHPSVVVFATTLMKGDFIEYNGDPLQDFTLMRFLDRFVYKNPKQKERDHGGSLMQPKTLSSRLAEQPVNTEAFLVKKEEDIREDEVFFHRYFKRKAETEKRRKKKTSESDDENSKNIPNYDNMQERSSTDFDFASELKSSKRSSSGKNKPSDSEEEEEGDDEEESEEQSNSEGENKEQSSSEDEFDYEAMDFSSAEEDEMEEPSSAQGKKRKFTDKDYEKALLENLSSDEFSDEDTPRSKRKSKKGKVEGSSVSSVFASAEEFAHLLENSEASRGGQYDVRRAGASDKQLKWEEKRAGKKWKVEHGSGREGRKGPQGTFNYSSRGKVNSKGRGKKRKR